MSDAITITLRLFGAFRSHGQQLVLTVPRGADVAAVKSALGAQIAEPQLIADSALASDSEVLAENAVFQQDMSLAILPPVCGG